MSRPSVWGGSGQLPDSRYFCSAHWPTPSAGCYYWPIVPLNDVLEGGRETVVGACWGGWTAPGRVTSHAFIAGPSSVGCTCSGKMKSILHSCYVWNPRPFPLPWFLPPDPNHRAVSLMGGPQSRRRSCRAIWKDGTSRPAQVMDLVQDQLRSHHWRRRSYWGRNHRSAAGAREIRLDGIPRRATTQAATCRDERPVGSHPARLPGMDSPAVVEDS